MLNVLIVAADIYSIKKLDSHWSVLPEQQNLAIEV